MVICTQVKMLQQQVIKLRKLLAQSTSDSAVWIPPRDAMWKDMWYIVSTLYIYMYIFIYLYNKLSYARILIGSHL